MSVERWLAEAQRGDAAAFNNLVQHYQGIVYHGAYQHLHDADDALDVSQEAVLSAWRAVRRFEGGPAQFKAWLLRIVVNAARDKLRSDSRRRHQPLETEHDGEAWRRPLPTPGMSPEEYAEVAELRDVLERCLAALSDDHRTVVLLDQAGLSYPEIADTLGVEVGTVKSRLSRARAHMRDLMTEAGVPGPGRAASPSARELEQQAERSGESETAPPMRQPAADADARTPEKTDAP